MNNSGNKNSNLQKKDETEYNPHDEVRDNNSCLTYSNKVFEVKPIPKFVIKNFEFDKVYKEKIQIKNLMEFPIVLNVKSSDSKKLEIIQIGNSIKLSALQSASLEINIKIEKKMIKNFLDKIRLYITFTSELVAMKYYVELDLSNKENNLNINKNFQSTKEFDLLYNSSSSILKNIQHNEKKQIKNLISNKLEKLNYSKIPKHKGDEYVEDNIINLSYGVVEYLNKKNEYAINNFNFEFGNSVTYDHHKEEKEILERENLYLKEKLNSYVAKLQEMEELINKYSYLIEASDKSNMNNLYLIQESTNDFTLYPYKLIHKNKIEPVTNYDDYSKVEGFINLITFQDEENKNFGINKTNKLLENTKTNPKQTENCENLSELQRDLGLHLNYLDSNNYNIEPEKKINSKLNSVNLKEDHIQEQYLKISHFDLYNVNDKVINSIKERFLQIEITELFENKKRMEEISEIVKNLLKLTSSLQVFSVIDFSSENSKTLSSQLEQADKLLKTFLNNLENYTESITNIEIIEHQILTRLSVVSQEPLLSNDEIDYLYKEINNVKLISQEMNRAKFKAEKLNYENELLLSENDKIRCLNEEILEYSKRLENDMDLYKKEILQKEDLAKLKERMLERLQNEIDEIRNNYDRPGKSN